MLSPQDRAKRWSLPPLQPVPATYYDLNHWSASLNDSDNDSDGEEDDWVPDLIPSNKLRTSHSSSKFTPTDASPLPSSCTSGVSSTSTTYSAVLATPLTPYPGLPTSPRLTSPPGTWEADYTLNGKNGGEPLTSVTYGQVYTPSRNHTQVPSQVTESGQSATVSGTEAKNSVSRHLLALFSSGVIHIPAHEIRTQPKKSILNGSYTESILYGDRSVLVAGEAALSAGGARPTSATRAIAANPARYGAPTCLPAALALAHAHCTMHDVFACDARLAPAEDYYDILRGFVNALTDWPAVAIRTSEPFDVDILELLELPHFEHGSGFSLGLRSEAMEVSIKTSGKRGVCGCALIPNMIEQDIVWSSSKQTLLDGWFPWLFVEPLGRCDDVSQGYIRLLSAMRTSLAMYSRIYNQARELQPKTFAPRTEGTRIVYGLQIIGVIWHVFAMAEDEGKFATAIIRQIGAEAKPRLRAVRNWLTCVLTEPRDPRPAVALGPGIAHLNLSPGIPIPDLTDQLDTPESATPPCLDPHPNTPLQTRYQSPEPSWKPWVEPFRPSVPVDRASSGRTACNPVKSNENILAPTPRQPPVVMEAWRTSLPFEHWRPTPSPFDYTTAYQHSWPLPSESTANQRMSGLGITHPSLWPSSRHNPTSSIAALKRLTLDLAPHAGASLTHSATQVQSQDACRNPSPRRNDRVRSPLSMYMAY